MTSIQLHVKVGGLNLPRWSGLVIQSSLSTLPRPIQTNPAPPGLSFTYKKTSRNLCMADLSRLLPLLPEPSVPPLLCCLASVYSHCLHFHSTSSFPCRSSYLKGKLLGINNMIECEYISVSILLVFRWA